MVETPRIRIFVCYRRQQDLAHARAIFESLRAELHDQLIIIDLEVTVGVDIASLIREQLTACQAVLALIGPNWSNATDVQGRRLLDREHDWLRIELALAFKLGIHVLPVLIGGASMPRPSELPDELKPLARRLAFEFDHHRFDASIARLAAVLRKGAQADPQRASKLEASPDPREQPARQQHRATIEKSSLGEVVRGAITSALTHTRRRVTQVLHPRHGEVLVAAPTWRAAWWLALAGLLLWGVVWPYLWPAMMPTPAAVAASEEPLPAATGPALPAGTRFRDCRDPSCPWLRVLPAGTFTMGSPDDEPDRDKDEGPQHQVTIAKPFAVMETEVTVGLFKAFVAETRYVVESGCRIWNGKDYETEASTTWRKPFAAVDQTDEHPVVCVDWHAAKALARWMTRRTGQPYRLFSEAEWEYAARAGSKSRYSFGDDPNQLCLHDNVADRRAKAEVPGSDGWTIAECDDGFAYTAPVGSFQPNTFGLYDMHGNAVEWVQDCQNEYTAGARMANAVEVPNCSRRLLRGGGWGDDPRSARSADRVHGEPSDRNSGIGFRLARMLP